MRNAKQIAIGSILFMCSVSAIATVLYNKAHESTIVSVYSETLEEAPQEDDPLIGLNEDYTANEEFTSHMPIIIIDTDGEEIEAPNMDGIQIVDEYSDHEDNDEMPEAEYVVGQISIVDNEDGINRIDDEPTIASSMIIKCRGNTSIVFEKSQYLIKLQTESGENNKVNVLDMGEHHEWILNGTLIDKSLMRNYLAFSIASEILEYTPDAVYCEVFIKEGDTYTYQGLYLMMETITQDENRVDIEDYSVTSSINSYILRRDRYDTSEIMLDTYGREQELAQEVIGVIYPSTSDISDDMITYIEEELEVVEKILYSDDINVYSTYSEYIDVDSFVDYFLINEFFINYDAGNHSTYFYKDITGKITMGPVWDFDGAMDNYYLEAVSIDDISFQIKPWFDMLCKDEVFVDKLITRYTELRSTTLSDANIIDKIDEITNHYGGAIDREWYRWADYHTSDYAYYGWELESLNSYIDDEGDVIDRNAQSYEEEIYRIKTTLRMHGDAMLGELYDLKEAAVWTTDASNYRGYFFLVVLIIFFAPGVYVYYKK